MERSIIFIGDKFYSESSTMMSSIYHENLTRCDWGKVNVYLRDGDTIKIRPATPKELSYFEQELKMYKEKHQHA